MRRAPVLLCVLGLVASPALAHDSANTVIHALTHRLEEEGPTARTLTARGFEYQAIGKTAEARADFQAALKLDPDYTPALLGAAEANLLDGRLGDAVAMARRGVAAASEPARQATFHALVARVHTTAGDHAAALVAWRAALRSPQVEIEWLLGEAESLGQLGRADERCDALAVAMTRNPSVVLRHAWIRALVDAGRIDAAEREVETELVDARWRSSWLLLRARIAGLRGDRARQSEDAAAAVAELSGRLNPSHPDPQLVADLATAEGLLRLAPLVAPPLMAR